VNHALNSLGGFVIATSNAPELAQIASEVGADAVLSELRIFPEFGSALLGKLSTARHINGP
jgi:hypothetical protein